MDLLSAIKISASGLSAQRTRMNVIASNLANANTTRTEDGSGPYKRKFVTFNEANFEQELLGQLSPGAAKVEVNGIEEDQRPAQKVYNPQHPDADEEGNVFLPNVNVVEEMVDMMAATRSYQANITAIKSAKEMVQAALSISR